MHICYRKKNLKTLKPEPRSLFSVVWTKKHNIQSLNEYHEMAKCLGFFSKFHSCKNNKNITMLFCDFHYLIALYLLVNQLYTCINASMLKTLYSMNTCGSICTGREEKLLQLTNQLNCCRLQQVSAMHYAAYHVFVAVLFELEHSLPANLCK